MKFSYSVAVRHQNTRTNVYSIDFDEEMDPQAIINLVKQEVPTARTVLCTVHPVELVEAA